MSRLYKHVLASLFLALVTTSAHAAQATMKNAAGSFQVKFNGGYLSVDAQEAPLGKILDEIRKQARITLEGNIAPEEKITIQFQHVAFDEALKRLSKNIGIIYTQDPKDKSHRVAGIVVLPERARMAAEQNESTKSSKVGGPSRPEPFKFEFDPTKSVQNKP